ncbi:hypothetical protein SMQE08_21530 [Serratia marcescens]|uniref:Uncharacterized protein n=1 Tax=Serratia surfactantfaciens TaxID=2741499 RepID=A0ABS0M0B5_9GAMM|nr:hypothetical protein [Serratia surfactantfaciens]AOE99743.1 hypothetical protein ATE40_010970 [Serratia surfactantfaciens]MBH1920994.1 hypothetical protein [Serratia surfactantfaciens]WMW59650.1 hypothetical protein RE680_13875 [Serratia marcescens]BEO38065.1 hypothetical protein SMQE08_21530 [Serratia marcescens]
MKPQNERPQLDAERLYLDPSLVFDEMERLRLARQVLCGIFAVSVGVFAAHAYWDKNEALNQVFELVKIGALPLVTLVVSFYFPNSAAR